MKKIWKSMEVCTILLLCALVLGIGMKAEAAVPGVAKALKQIDAGPNSVEISWDAVIGNNIQYKVELCEDSTFTGDVMDNLEYNNKEQIIDAARNPDESFSGLSPGKKYYVRVTAFRNTGYPDYICTWGYPSDDIEVVTAPMNSDIVDFKQTKATETSITLSWKKYSGANAYQLSYVKKGASKKKTIPLKNVKSYTVNNLSKNAEYEFWLWPVRESSSGFRALSGSGSELYWCPVLPSKVTGVACTFEDPSSNLLNVKWNLRPTAVSYQYQIYAEGGKKALLTGKTTKNVSKARISNNKLKGLRFLKLRMRACVKVDESSKYGAWSEWVYFSRQPKVKLASTKSGMKVSWDKVSGASSYSVYISKNRSSGYKKVQSTTKTSTIVNKCGKSALKSGKTYYFIVTANKKMGKKNFQSTRNFCFWRIYGK